MTDLTPPAHRLVALLLAVPALVVGAWLAWTDTRPVRAESTPSDSSFLIEALREDAIERSFAYFRSGHDPNEPVPFRDDRLTGGTDVMVTPLLIAVALDRADTVRMLMSSGARLDARGNRYAVCLARRLGHTGIADLLLQDGGADAAAAACPRAEQDEEAPLRAYVD
jgi:hypothetical protein